MSSAVMSHVEPDVVQHRVAPSMVERLTLIMDAFDRPHRRLTLDEVVTHSSLPRSTAHRILDQLVRMSWLDHSSLGYALGTRALSLGGREVGHSVLRAAAAPHLHRMAMQTGMVVHLAVPDGNEIYYLDKLGGQAAAAVPSAVGRRAPAHCTAVGKAILAATSPEHVDDLYRLAPPLRRTERSIAGLPELHRELVRIRGRQGLAFDAGEFVGIISCVGVALRCPNGPVGAISIVGHSRVALQRVAPIVVATGKAINTDLFATQRVTRDDVIALLTDDESEERRPRRPFGAEHRDRIEIGQ